MTYNWLEQLKMSYWVCFKEEGNAYPNPNIEQALAVGDHLRWGTAAVTMVFCTLLWQLQFHNYLWMNWIKAQVFMALASGVLRRTSPQLEECNTYSYAHNIAFILTFVDNWYSYIAFVLCIIFSACIFILMTLHLWLTQCRVRPIWVVISCIIVYWGAVVMQLLHLNHRGQVRHINNNIHYDVTCSLTGIRDNNRMHAVA